MQEQEGFLVRPHDPVQASYQRGGSRVIMSNCTFIHQSRAIPSVFNWLNPVLVQQAKESSADIEECK